MGRVTSTAPPPAAGRPPAPADLSHLRHLALSSFWFGLNFHWLPIGFVLIQSQTGSLVPPARYGSYLGALLGVGGIFAIGVPPLVGQLSDHLHTPWGRRRPLIFTCTLVNLAGLAILMTAASYAQLFAGYLFIQLFANAAGAAYAGVIPDIVPDRQFGRGSGYLAMMYVLGGLAGVLATGQLAAIHQVRLSYLVIGAVLVLTMLPALAASRGEGTAPVSHAPRVPLTAEIRNFLAPLWTGDFGWVIVTRLMVTAAITVVAAFLSPFFHYVVRAANPDQFTANWLGIVFVFAVPFGIAGGMISDRSGRKRFVYASGVVQGLVVLAFIVLYPPPPALAIGLGAAYGLGYGLYYAVDWALACDTLPDRRRSAKDMGLFHVALTLPQTIVPAIAGFVLDFFNARSPNSGYRVVFGSAIVFFALGTFFVSRIRSVR